MDYITRIEKMQYMNNMILELKQLPQTAKNKKTIQSLQQQIDDLIHN